jgi:hypothetical protein
VSKQSSNQVKIIPQSEESRLNVKAILAVFLDCQGLACYRGQETVNQEFDLIVLPCIQGAV